MMDNGQIRYDFFILSHPFISLVFSFPFMIFGWLPPDEWGRVFNAQLFSLGKLIIDPALQVKGFGFFTGMFFTLIFDNFTT